MGELSVDKIWSNPVTIQSHTYIQV